MNGHKAISLPSIFLTPPCNHRLTLTSQVTDRSLAALPAPLEFPSPLAHSSAGCLCWPARRLCCFKTCFSGGCCRIVFGFSPVSSIQVRVCERGWVMMLKLSSPVYPVLPLPSSKPETQHAGMRMEWECRCGSLKRQHWHVPVVELHSWHTWCCSICLSLIRWISVLKKTNIKTNESWLYPLIRVTFLSKKWGSGSLVCKD